MGSLLEEPHGQVLSEGKVAPTSEPNPSMSARVSHTSSPRGVYLGFRFIAASRSLCRSKLNRAEPPGLRRTDQKSLADACAS